MTDKPALRRIAAAICAVEGLVILGFLAFYLYELTQGEGEDLGRILMSMVLMALAGVGLVAMARGWLAGRAWPRTPTILWNLLMLPVAWSMKGAGFWGALPLALAAVVAIACSLAVSAQASDDDVVL